jgi:hypothetical protein
MGETHGRMKDQNTTLEGLNITYYKFNPFRVEIYTPLFSTGFTGGYSNLIPLGLSGLKIKSLKSVFHHGNNTKRKKKTVVKNTATLSVRALKIVKNPQRTQSLTLISPKTLALQTDFNRNFRNLAKLD